MSNFVEVDKIVQKARADLSTLKKLEKNGQVSVLKGQHS